MRGLRSVQFVLRSLVCRRKLRVLLMRRIIILIVRILRLLLLRFRNIMLELVTVRIGIRMIRRMRCRVRNGVEGMVRLVILGWMMG